MTEKKVSINKQKKLITYIVLIFIAVIIIIILIYLSIRSHQTLYSADKQYGNVTANIYNKGLFCENDGEIFFSNIYDDGTLYSMNSSLDGFKKLYNDKVQYINVDENYVYYSRMNNQKATPSESVFVFYSNGIFRVRKDGSLLRMLHNSPVGALALYDNRIFYQYYEKGKKLAVHRIDIAGENDVPLVFDDCVPGSIYNDKIYCTGTLSDHNINEIDTNSGGSSPVLLENSYMPVGFDNKIYFIATLDGYHVCRINLDGSGRETLVKTMCSTYNIMPDGSYLIYQADGGSNNGVYSLNLHTGETTSILSGNFKQIHVTDTLCFFYSFDDSGIYYFNPADNHVKPFNPPVLEE